MTHHTQLVPSTEVAPEGAWFKSTYSDQGGGDCVEVAGLSDQIGIRDSKDKCGPALVVPAAAWSSFVGRVRSGDVD
ncbi:MULTISPECIES: DUF397 domain-containing protein [unclassified Streptomyces]|uniref:DUF397 domain-containing protein n=1 Tax=unclassified Streptomyces TaxID=2593676 RepID=UPI00278C5A73|nr:MULTISPECIES: DUF397 domain-containing protein [unclassified Streptomyces]